MSFTQFAASCDFLVQPRVVFHGARAERDHRPVECEVSVGQATEVAKHLVLGSIAMEHAVGKDLVGPTGEHIQTAVVEKMMLCLEQLEHPSEQRNIAGLVADSPIDHLDSASGAAAVATGNTVRR